MPPVLRRSAIALSLSCFLLCPAISHSQQLSAFYSPVESSFFDRLTLTDQNGLPVGGNRLRGKIVLLNFIFTHCDTSCPVQTEQLAALQSALPAELRPRVLFVSVSVDPANDTPAMLKKYALERHLDQRQWTFVTGPPSQIARLTHRFDVFAADKHKPGTGFHTTDIRLFSPSGRMVQRYAGVPVDQIRLLREIEALASSSIIPTA